jgi:hypothetical protein
MRKVALSAFIIFCCALFFGGRTAQEGSLPDRTIGGGPAPGAAVDGASAWTPIGPYGGEIHGLARNPKYANELYAAASAYPSQFFRSTNNGLTWTRTAVFDYGVTDVATYPKNAAIVYVYTEHDLYKSSDRGASFPDKYALPTSFIGYNGRVALHPTNPKIIFVSGYAVTSYSPWKACAAVCKTVNGGQSWTLLKLDSAVQYGYIYDIGIHPKNPNIIYLCGEQTKDGKRRARVYKSTNGGGSYKNITQDGVFNPGQNNCWTYALALHPTDPNSVFIGHQNGVARTTNGGSTWQNQSSPAPGNFYAAALAVDKSKPSTLYALSINNLDQNRGCWKSTDGGITWKQSKDGIYGYGTRLLINGNSIIASTWAGIFKSQNAGVVWKASHSGIRASRPDAFGVAPSSAQTIYTEVANYALFKTTNGGGAWAQCPDFYRCESIIGFVVHPSNPKSLFFLAGG